ncbi:MAG: hypothetical protein SGJ20_18430 [Planctomycetota bacterium]|nr:hypothetical protein [Planctomycetota bacterium]
MNNILPLRYLLALCLVGTISGQLLAAPAVTSLSHHGLRKGNTTALEIRGTELAPQPRILLGSRTVAAKVAPDATGEKLGVKIDLPADFPSGIHLLRVVTPDGISGGTPITVDHLLQIAPADRLDQLPVAISGTLSGEQMMRTKINAKQNQTITIEVEARRLHSPLQPIIRLYDSRGVQQAWAQGAKTLLRDARLHYVVPADGEYTIELHDAAYAAAPNSPYRLKVGDWAYADVVFPLAIQRGTKSPLEFIADRAGSVATAEVTAESNNGFLTQPLPGDKNFSGMQPVLIVSDQPETIEVDSGSPQQVSVPGSFNGRISKAFQEGRFLVNVTPGAKLSFDVQAMRSGSPLDAVLTIYDAKDQKVLLDLDDRPNVGDPGMDLTVPADTSAILVGVRDALGRSGPDYVYRVNVRPKVEGTFALTLPNPTTKVAPLGQTMLTVDAQRQGYDGPIELELQGLPPGVIASNTRIEAGSSIGRVLLSANDEAEGTAMIRVLGHSMNGNERGPVLAVAKHAESELSKRYTWLREEVPLVVVRPSPISISWGPTSPSALGVGQSIPVQPRVIRRAGQTGPVRLSLVTNQAVVTKDGAPDPDRSLRFEREVIVPSDQSSVATKLVAPLNLSTGSYIVLLRAELLSADGKQVLATTHAPAIPMSVERPLSLELTGTDTLKVQVGTGVARLTGRVKRSPGFEQPLRIVLTSLPNGLPNLFQDLEGSQSDFDIEVRLPYSTNRKQGITAEVIAVTLGPDKSKEIRSNSLPIKIQPGRGSRPAINPPQRIFDDEPEFLEQLTEGGGKPEFTRDDKYSGTGSLLVTPDQRLNVNLPNVQFKIRKNPGPGEFRYLRFAWRKRGGAQICLQIAHDGKLGPAGPRNAPFRYHAGAGQCFDGSLTVSPNLPEEWQVVTRDLYADFGEFTLTGLGFTAVDGQEALFDFVYLGRTVDDVDAIEVKK